LAAAAIQLWKVLRGVNTWCAAPTCTCGVLNGDTATAPWLGTDPSRRAAGPLDADPGVPTSALLRWMASEGAQVATDATAPVTAAGGIAEDSPDVPVTPVMDGWEKASRAAASSDAASDMHRVLGGAATAIALNARADGHADEARADGARGERRDGQHTSRRRSGGRVEAGQVVDRA